MLALTSNLDEVIADTRTLRDVTIPAAMQGALEPGGWKPEAQKVARETIYAIARHDEWGFVEPFVKAVYATLFGGELVIGLREPGGHFATAVAQMNLPGAGGKFGELQVEDVTQFEQMVLEWVTDKKRWDVERDGDKTAENIVSKALWIADLLLASPTMLAASAAEPGGMSPRDARDSLLPAVLEYIAQQTRQDEQQQRLDADTAGEWLAAILAAWGVMLRVKYPQRVRELMRN